MINKPNYPTGFDMALDILLILSHVLCLSSSIVVAWLGGWDMATWFLAGAIYSHLLIQPRQQAWEEWKATQK